VIRRVLLALLVIGGVGLALALPPRALVVPPTAGAPPILRGAVHVHTTNSDGSGTPDQVAAAAGRAGLAFVILTDHGDGTRIPDSSRYRSGVLMIDAVELSTSGGHIVALDLPRAAYPLRGEPADVLEDLARLGAMAIVSHPTSLKEDLRWHDAGRPFDGIEWLNFDSEWRDNRALTLLRVLLTYWFRPAESLGEILDRPTEAIEVWDRAAAASSVVGLAGSDAHAKIGGDMDHGGPAAVHLPSYEQMFRTFSIGLPGLTLSQQPAADAAAVVGAIRAGHVFSVIDAFARPGRLSFTAVADGRRAEAGDRLPTGRSIMLHADVDAPASTPTLTLYRNGQPVASASAAMLDYAAGGEPATYRIEATLPEPGGGLPRAPWLVSNPIYVGAVAPWSAKAPPSPVTRQPIDRDGSSAWTVEHSVLAAGDVGNARAIDGTQLHMRYALGGARADGPFVAFAVPVRGMTGFMRLMFAGHAKAPMRVSVQLRAAAGQGSGRWRRSVYLDENQRTISLPFDEFRAAESSTPAAPSLETISSLLFVIDTMNTALGTNGEFWIDDVSLVR
jgi:hypothetical protein